MSPQLGRYLTALFLGLAYDEMTFEQALDRAAAELSKDQSLDLKRFLNGLRARPEDVAGVEEVRRQVAHRFGYSLDGTLSGLLEAIAARVSASR